MKKKQEVKSEVVRLSCVFLAAVILVAAVPALRAQSSIIAPGAKVELLAGGFKFTEGPAGDKAGNVYFTDQPNDKILIWSTDGKLSTFMEKSGRSNGLSFDHKGNLWACADQKNELWRISRSGKPTVSVKDYDGKILYIADLGGQKTYRYDIQRDGTLANKTLFCEMGSDGMTIDSEGNVYLSGKGVTVFNPAGKKIEQIPIDAPWTANMCFGGKDYRTLFITAMQNLFSLRMRIKGAGSQ